MSQCEWKWLSEWQCLLARSGKAFSQEAVQNRRPLGIYNEENLLWKYLCWVPTTIPGDIIKICTELRLGDGKILTTKRIYQKPICMVIWFGIKITLFSKYRDKTSFLPETSDVMVFKSAGTSRGAAALWIWPLSSALGFSDWEGPGLMASSEPQNCLGFFDFRNRSLPAPAQTTSIHTGMVKVLRFYPLHRLYLTSLERLHWFWV